LQMQDEESTLSSRPSVNPAAARGVYPVASSALLRGSRAPQKNVLRFSDLRPPENIFLRVSAENVRQAAGLRTAHGQKVSSPNSLLPPRPRFGWRRKNLGDGVNQIRIKAYN